MMNKNYPKTLSQENHFIFPLFVADAPEFVEDLNKFSDKHIEHSKKHVQSI